MRVLGLFAKQPLPGQVKTRLAAAISPAGAARVARAFLDDLLDRLTVVAAQRLLAFAPPEAESFFASLARGRFALTPQAGGDLGRRLAAFFADQIRAGAERTVVLGTDSPTLPLDHVEQAFRELEHADVVLGPATDGGYYLVGCARRLPPIFDGIAWGTPRVLADTVARLAAPHWRLALLPPWYDVDTLDDWQALRGHLAALRRAGLDPGVPHTEALPPP
jgi:rSAM/selenodomain-associated transferase 1